MRIVPLARRAVLGCLLATASHAFEIVETSPKRYELAIQPTLTGIDVEFDAPPAVPVAAAVRVCGAMSGLHGKTLQVAGNTLRIRNLSGAFLPGELVQVGLRSDVAGAGGGTLAGGRVFAFTIASGPCTPDWSSVTTYGTADKPYFIFGGDLNGDDAPDLAVPNENSDNVSVFLNAAGNGSFPLHAETAVGAVPSSIFGEDFDNDGDLDVATADIFGGTITVLKNNGSGAMGDARSYFAGIQTRQIHGGDFDGDNDVDLCATSRDTDEVYLFYNDGSGQFTGVPYTNVASGPFAIRSGDFDRDGHLDIGVACQDADSLIVMHNNGNGSFTTSGRYLVGNGPWCLNGNDFDGDGDFDLVSVASFARRIVVLYNDGAGGFGTKNQWLTGIFPLGVYAADLDGDGDIDAASSNYSGASVGVYLNDGAGNLGAPTTLSMSLSGSYTWAHDLDGDGDLDLSAVDEESDELFIFLNNGTASDAITPEGGRARLTAWPNPLRAGRTLVLRAEGGGATVAPLALWSIDGRLVRRIAGRAGGAGLEFEWDGRDAHGRAVASGRYIATCTTPAGARIARPIQVVR
jgi:hypothetical protein